jgi:hypothetical protein
MKSGDDVALKIAAEADLRRRPTINHPTRSETVPEDPAPALR